MFTRLVFCFQFLDSPIYRFPGSRGMESWERSREGTIEKRRRNESKRAKARAIFIFSFLLFQFALFPLFHFPFPFLGARVPRYPDVPEIGKFEQYGKSGDANKQKNRRGNAICTPISPRIPLCVVQTKDAFLLLASEILRAYRNN